MIRNPLDWSSHLPILIRLIHETNGRVLELGTGIFSTPFLHWACAPNRKLVSYESDPKFFSEANLYTSETHEVKFVHDWDLVNLTGPWDIAFIDHKPDERRGIEAKRLASEDVKFVVLHDSQPSNDYAYHYDEVYPLYKYRRNYDFHRTHTTVLSNVIEL